MCTSQKCARRCGTLGLLTALACTSPFTGAQSYRIGVEESSYFPRYGLVDGQFSGYAWELLESFAADSGHQFEYVPLSEDALLHQLLTGAVDLRYPDSPAWYGAYKPKDGLAYSRPLDYTLVGLLVAPGREGDETLETLAVLQGFKLEPFAEVLERGELTVYPVARPEHLATLGLAGLVDGIYGDPYVVDYHLRRQGGVGEVLVLDHSFPTSLHDYRLSTLRYPELMIEFDRWFANHYDRVLKLRRDYGITDL